MGGARKSAPADPEMRVGVFLRMEVHTLTVRKTPTGV